MVAGYDDFKNHIAQAALVSADTGTVSTCSYVFPLLRNSYCQVKYPL
jgi:hypothetical protein